MRVIFMGTAAFAVPSLAKIFNSKHQVVTVVTAVDKPGGRGRKTMISSPVKQFAIDNQLPLLQPENLKNLEFTDALRSLNADIFVVVAFRMLPQIVWSIPSKGTINLHASLLPAYRGAAPINWAIINGEKTTGVTTFVINQNIDTGNVLLQKSIDIDPEDNAGTLHDKLMYEGADLLLETINRIEEDSIIPTQQNEYGASHAPKIFKETGQIHEGNTVKNTMNLIRGLSPYPGAWLNVNEETEMKVYNAQPVELAINATPGTLFLHGKNQLFYVCNDGILEILEVQLQGKKRMKASEMLNGSSYLFRERKS